MRSGRLTAVCSVLACLLLYVSGSAQYRFNSWTADNGLPQNSVLAIVQTRDGYLWFTTLDGLVRYDGVEFKVFNRANRPGIGSNRFSSLHEDREGTLWIGTENGGLTSYRDGRFTTYTTINGLPHNRIIGIFGDKSGLVILTQSGFARLSGNRFVAYDSQPEAMGVKNACLGRSGTLWYNTQSGLFSVKDSQVGTLALPDEMPARAIRSIYEDSHGALWIGMLDGKVARWHGGAFTIYSVSQSPIWVFYEDRQANLWIGTQGAGLVRFREGRFNSFSTEDGLSSKWIRSIYEDREGTLWIGTNNNGINRLSRQLITTHASDSNVYPVYQDRAGQIWLGTWGQGLRRYTEKAQYPVVSGLAGANVTALFEDREGRLWVGTLYTVGWIENGVFIDFTAKLGLSGVAVLVIYQDSRGALWFGTRNKLLRYSDGKVTSYTTDDGLAGNDVRDILEDRQGNLWIATIGGLSCFRNEQLVSYFEENGLASNQVRTLYEDSDGALWIGTYDGGLNRFKDGRFTRYTSDDGLFNNGVFRILEDDRGYFWISCNRGIYRVRRQDLNDFAEGRISRISSVPYGKEDGMFNTECNGGQQPAGFKARDGRLWFPTQGGVAVLNPADVPFNPEPPPVLIQDCLVEHKPVDSGDVLRIEPGQENLEIRYAALSFIKPDQVKFKYKLEGLDEDWLDAGNRRVAYYAHLPPGNYSFAVIAANSDGVWNSTGATIRILVVPPFWRTWWFMSILGVMLATAGFMMYQHRVSRLKRANASQEAFSRQLIDSQERERKRIATELHDSLGQNLLVIKNWAILGLNTLEESDRGRKELQEISAAASDAVGEVRQISYNLRPHLLDEVGLTKSLESMLKGVVASSKIQFSIDLDPVDDLFSKDDEISIYRIVQEGVNNIVRHAQATEAAVSVVRGAQDVQITIRDNGKGFDLQAIQDGRSGRKGLGMIGMAERARMLGGALVSHSAPGQGTTIKIKLGLDGKLYEG